MALIHTDVIKHILSYHPVRDPTFDNCVEQIKYFIRYLEEYRTSKWATTRSHYRKVHFHTFILSHRKPIMIRIASSNKHK